MNVTPEDRDLGAPNALKPPRAWTEPTAADRGTPTGELLQRC